MKKLVLAGVFVFGSGLLNVHAMSGNREETQDVNRNISTGMQLVQTRDTGELTVADLKLDEFKTLMYDCISAVYGEQAKEDPKFKLLATVLDDKHKSQMRTLAMLAQSEKNRQKDTFDRQMEAKDAQLEKARNENIRLERERELQSQISRVFIANRALKPERIMIRSAEINRMTDIFKKRAAVQAEYSKFELFSDLLRREDLGINAKQSDLTKISEYLNNTKISPKPDQPTLIRDAFWTPNLCKGGFVSLSLPIFPDDDFIRGKYGLTRVRREGGGFLGLAHYDEVMTVDWYNRCKDIENKERKNAHENAVSNWNAAVSKASAVPLPSEEFDRLVEQFNTFLSKL